jgi:hypothetical protein
MTSKEEQEAIDAALDAALDELDEEDDEKESHDSKGTAATETAFASDGQDTESESIPQKDSQQDTKPAPMMGPPRPPVSDEKKFTDMMEQMLRIDPKGGDVSDEFVGELMQGMQSQFAAELQKVESVSSTDDSKPKESPSKTRKSDKVSSSADSVDKAISSLVEGMAKEETTDAPGSSSSREEADMLKSLMQGLEGMGDGDFNADAVLDGMMGQLLSKDLMYEPIKQFALSFPPWLEERKDTFSKEEYSRYVIGKVEIP